MQMNSYWVYRGVVKACINGSVVIVGRVTDSGLSAWRLYANGRAS